MRLCKLRSPTSPEGDTLISKYRPITCIQGSQGSLTHDSVEGGTGESSGSNLFHTPIEIGLYAIYTEVQTVAN